MSHWLAGPGAALHGELRVPGDKSVSHRSVMFAALAEGCTEVRGFLEGEDSLHTLAAFDRLGSRSRRDPDGTLHIEGVGLHGLSAAPEALYLGNSGTAMRLLTGVLAGQAFASVLTGDASLSARPMRRVADPLNAMGARVSLTAQGTPPVRVQPVPGLRGIDYRLPVASAQVKSAVLLAGLYARGQTRVHEPAVTRDHTERMLQTFGYPLRQQDGCVALEGGGRLTATRVAVPGDISSAAFFLVAASLVPGSDLLLRDVGVNPTRDGVLEILRLMGADIEVLDRRDWGAEPVADLRVRAAPLHGVDIPAALVSRAIDEFPVLFVAAAAAAGETRLTGAAELRVKESDRIGVMAEALAALGVEARAQADGMTIRGGRLGGARVHSHGDHRVAMALAVAAQVAGGEVRIEDTDNVATSYPGFAAQALAAGLDVREGG